MSCLETIRSWVWVLVPISILHFFGFRLVEERRAESRTAFLRIEQLHHAIHLAKERKEELSRQIEAFEDPSWMEEVLKEELGIVRRTETKILFTP